MANAATTKNLYFPGMELVEVTVTWDTVETFAVAHGGPQNVDPLFVIHSIETQGTDVISLSSDMDLANDEVDITILVENAGTLGTPVTKTYLFFPAVARQDGQSINSDNNA